MSVVSFRIERDSRQRSSVVGALPLGFSKHLAKTEENGDLLLLSLAGLRTTANARLLVNARSPEDSPDIRAQLGLLLAEEPSFFLGGSVRRHVEEARRLRASQGVRYEPSVGDALLASLAQRPTPSLDRAERRMLALALALELELPAALLCFDPYRGLPSTLTPSSLEHIRSRFTHLGAKCPILVLGPSERALEAYPGRHLDSNTLAKPRVRIVADQGHLLAAVLEKEGCTVTVLPGAGNASLLEIALFPHSHAALQELLRTSADSAGSRVLSVRISGGSH